MPATLDPERFESACARILASRTFADAPRLRRFFQYVAELTAQGRQDEIKEYSLGVDVFERPPSFEPKTDPIVRVQAGRLRLKLLEYYDQEGRDDPARIEIPKGGYAPVLHFRDQQNGKAPVINGDAPHPLPGVAPQRAPSTARKWLLGAVAAAVGLAGGIILWSRLFPAPLTATSLRRLTSVAGSFGYHTISPDGRFLAYESNERDRGRWDVMMLDTVSGSAVPVPDIDGHVGSASFCGDGRWLAVTRDPPVESTGENHRIPSLFVLPALGGTKRKIAEDVGMVRCSPDGKWIAFFRPRPGRIFVIPPAGGEERRLATDFERAQYMVWVDSNHLLFLGHTYGTEPELDRLDWWVTPVDGGPVIKTGAYALLRKHVIDVKRSYLLQPYAWYRGNLLFSAQIGENINIWSLPISERSWLAAGQPRQVTFGSGQELRPIVSPGGVLVFASDHQKNNLFSYSVNPTDGTATGAPREMTRNSVLNYFQSPSPDGRKLAYISNRSGDWELWLRDLDSNQETLALRSADKIYSPVFSPDGTTIAFLLKGPDHQKLNIMPASGGSPHVVCSPCGIPIAWMPDGSQIVIQAGDLSVTKRLETHVALADVRTGSVQRASGQPAGSKPISLSPDGNRLVLELVGGKMGRDGFERVVVPFREAAIGPESEWFRLPLGFGSIQWSLNGELLYFESRADGHPCIWAQRFHPRTGAPIGKPFPALHLHDGNRELPRQLDRFLAVTRNALVVTVLETAAELWTAQLR